MSMFSNTQNEAMVKYMDAFIELASLVPEIEKTDIAALHNLSMYIKDDCDLAPEVADGYRAVYDRVHSMIFTGNVKQTPYITPTKGLYKHRFDFKNYGKGTSRRDWVLCSLVFSTHEEAKNFYNTLINYISNSGSVTVEDVINGYDEAYGPIGYKTTYYDSRVGWTNLPSKPSDVIVRDGSMWKVVLPKPAVLQIR